MEDIAVNHPACQGPISLRISVTDRCQFRCIFCMPADGLARLPREEILRYEEILAFVRLIRERFGLAKVHVTGGEPLERRGIVDFIGMLHRDGAADLAMTTNGQRLAEAAAELKAAGLGRVNVSLYTLNGQTFHALTRGGDLSRTLAGMDAAMRAGLSPVKCNTILLAGVNDHEAVDIARFALRRGIQARFIELMPIGPAAGRHGEWFVSSAQTLDRLRQAFELQQFPRRAGSSSVEYRLADTDGRTGVVGLISSCSQPFCADCNRLRLTADGRLVGCLAAGGSQSILPLLRAGGPGSEREILDRVAVVMKHKRAGCGFSTGRYMVQTGG